MTDASSATEVVRRVLIAVLASLVLATVCTTSKTRAAEPANAAAPAAPLSVPADDCAIRVFDVSPDRGGDVVRFVLGGHAFRGASANVDFVTSKTLYGLTLSNLTLTTVPNASGFDISQPYGAKLPDASDLKGVFVTSYTDADGVKHDCDMLDGLPLDALPFFASAAHDAQVEAQAGMRAAQIVALPVAELLAYGATYDCATPFRKATIVRPEEPVYPQNHHLRPGDYQVIVRVTIDADGKAADGVVAASSGNAAIDGVAVEAAKRSTYAPAIADCVRAPSTYLFRSDFESQ